MRLDPNARAFLATQARQQLPATRDLEAGRYSADDFIRYDLTDDVLTYLATAFDVLEVIAINRRRLRIDEARTVDAFDIIAKADNTDPTLVIPVALSIWPHEPHLPND